MRAIEAGYAAGGELVGQMSAGLVVCAPDMARPLIDLRVDMAHPGPAEGGDAVKDLRLVFDTYRSLIPYYATFWLDNPTVQSADGISRAA